MARDEAGRRADAATTTGGGAVPIIAAAESFVGGTPVQDMAIVLMKAWGECDPDSQVAQHPHSYVTNFADMAKAGMRFARDGIAEQLEDHVVSTLAPALGYETYRPGSPGYTPGQANYAVGELGAAALVDEAAAALRGASAEATQSPTDVPESKPAGANLQTSVATEAPVDADEEEAEPMAVWDNQEAREVLGDIIVDTLVNFHEMDDLVPKSFNNAAETILAQYPSIYHPAPVEPASVAAVAQILCGCDGTRRPYCQACGYKMGEHECPDRVACTHDAATEKARKVLSAFSPARLAQAVDRPRIVCLCGSTRFYDAFQQANYDLTMRGEIVLSVGFYPHAKAEHGHGEGVGHDSVEKVALDELHKRKIDLADYVYVLNVGGYIGESTRSEIEYALAHGVPVKYLERGED